MTIDLVLFAMAFNRDVDFHDVHPQSAYLETQTGAIYWVYKNDEDAYDGGITAADNEGLRRQIEEAPERFLEIPGRSHAEHHALFRDFFDSEWTEDESLREQAKAAYFPSIGGWKKAVSDDTSYAYKDFVERRLREMGENFLREHGIEPVWR